MVVLPLGLPTDRAPSPIGRPHVARSRISATPAALPRRHADQLLQLDWHPSSTILSCRRILSRPLSVGSNSASRVAFGIVIAPSRYSASSL